MPGALPRVHLVTPAVVERTVARYGVHGSLANREQATVAAFCTVAVALCRCR